MPVLFFRYNNRIPVLPVKEQKLLRVLIPNAVARQIKHFLWAFLTMPFKISLCGALFYSFDLIFKRKHKTHQEQES